MAGKGYDWAKVEVGMRADPRLVTRPDSDRLLWLCMRLHAKQHSPDDGIVRLDAATMRGLWAIKAPQKAVDAALAYFVNVGMLLRTRDGYLIADFVESQKVGGDTYEAHAERQRNYYARNKGRQRVTSPLTASLTSALRHHDGVSTDADVEKEKSVVSTYHHEKATPEAVEQLRAKAKDLAESDRLQVHKLLDSGLVSEAAILIDDLEALRRPA